MQTAVRARAEDDAAGRRGAVHSCGRIPGEDVHSIYTPWSRLVSGGYAVACATAASRRCLRRPHPEGESASIRMRDVVVSYCIRSSDLVPSAAGSAPEDRTAILDVRGRRGGRHAGSCAACVARRRARTRTRARRPLARQPFRYSRASPFLFAPSVRGRRGGPDFHFPPPRIVALQRAWLCDETEAGRSDLYYACVHSHTLRSVRMALARGDDAGDQIDFGYAHR